MKINKITPQSYCSGVKLALIGVDKVLNDDSIKKPIYLLGDIIHNTHVMNDIKKRGVIIINDNNNKTRLEMLDEINSGTVIFSAHGVSPSVYEKAKSKGLDIYDATCINVKLVHNNIIKHLENGYSCIYIGTKNHPECEGVLGISSSIKLVSNLDDIKKLDINNDKIYITNQTTLSMFDTLDIFDELISLYPNALIDDKICNTTTKRQEAVKYQEPVDLCIVVGDPKSSNTKKLYEVSKNIANIKTTMCESLDTLDKSLLNGINSVSITSGASTPIDLVDEIIEYLKEL